jgi:hypothetical protein
LFIINSLRYFFLACNHGVLKLTRLEPTSP